MIQKWSSVDQFNFFDFFDFFDLSDLSDLFDLFDLLDLFILFDIFVLLDLFDIFNLFDLGKLYKYRLFFFNEGGTLVLIHLPIVGIIANIKRSLSANKDKPFYPKLFVKHLYY